MVLSKALGAALVLAALIANGCATARAQQSTFFSKFSLNRLMGKSSAAERLECDSAAAGGGSDNSDDSFYERKWESRRCRIISDDGGRFDEAELFKSLREEVKKEIQASGAQIADGEEMDAGGFHVVYSSGSMQGRIDMTGKKTEEGYYDLKAVLEEKGQK